MWEIEHQCPQCSAPVVFSESDRLFTCPYCRVKLFVTSHGPLTYYLPPRTGNDDDGLFFMPYSRIKGIGFTCSTEGIRGNVIDRTSLARPSAGIPTSLGVRPQALKLRLMHKEFPGCCIAPVDTPDSWRPKASSTAFIPGSLDKAIPATVVMWRFLNETSSIIYNPFQKRAGNLYDGISREYLGKIDDLREAPVLTASPSGMTFIPALCPNCGAELPAEKESVAVPCLSCSRLWEVSEKGLREKSFFQLPANGTDRIRYLPFWRIKGAGKPFERTLFMDRSALDPYGTHGPAPILLEDFFFWIPAFTISPDLFLRITHRATILQPQADGENSTAIFDHVAHPVNVSAEEAGKLLSVILGSIVWQREKALPYVASAEIDIVEYCLVLVPFSVSGHELLHREMCLSLHVNALKYGRNV